ncbi:hypothetical protein HYDPIDRAFT_117882 [Hydnomerulius pinastri MD-312]|uniref:Lysophospholipase n=1 Tax=Hydnomerulius pinastri MD-312 TaxID=994086 RepID=A0A0C9VQH3_9AGAM|nr:hypothetical protein HYDPIDRAFT_117882 [Hydnomerulius pinastri MD-312]
MSLPAQILRSILLALPLVASAQNLASELYTPQTGLCPEGFSLVRETGPPSQQSINPDELHYISSRKTSVLPGAWKTYLENVRRKYPDLPGYVTSILASEHAERAPTFSIATSGGGYRAALFGAGVLNAIDGRNSSSVDVGTGGLLQTASYLAGLSGGSQLVTSLAQADFPTMGELIFGDPLSLTSTDAYGGWLTQFNQLAPTGNTTTDNEYIQTLIEEVRGKFEAGFALSFNDVYARDFARHVINGTNADNFMDASLAHGAGLTFSGISNVSSFVSYSQPFPIIVATLISQHANFSTIVNSSTVNVPQSSPMFEINVYELGSYDPTLAAFTPMKYIGTTNSSMCVTGYDQTTFLVGASSDFDTVYNTSAQAELSNPINPIIEMLNETFPQTGLMLDVALFPNAFYGVTNGTFIDAGEHFIGLTDGGNDGEPIPLQPLMVKAREVDVILAIDGMADTPYNFAAGSSLINTQNRTSLFPESYTFPPVPLTIADFIAQNLSTSPTFFGCDSSDSTPFIIYLANGGPPHDGEPALTNITASQLPLSQLQPILDQSFVIATQGRPATLNEVTDPEWPACLACAVVDRARVKVGAERTGVCASCFDRYCWNGSKLGL